VGRDKEGKEVTLLTGEIKKERHPDGKEPETRRTDRKPKTHDSYTYNLIMVRVFGRKKEPEKILFGKIPAMTIGCKTTLSRRILTLKSGEGGFSIKKGET